ncbi:MAG: Uma2 family endonuclease [Betaproteobacteria bacterium]|nr:Uma2 family endonuclease [Betaproteobacteria bacterium]
MGLPQRKHIMTAQEFIDWENAQPDKHEFLAGEVFAMVGARRIHVAITLNIAAKLKDHLRGGPCRAFMADMKLQVQTADAVFYPDVLVTCHPDDLKADLTMSHPKVIIEVLSESTAAYDRGEKFALYRQLESLQEYVLIDPDTRRIEVFRRMDSGDWLLAASESAQGLILKSLDFKADPDAVFEDV